MTWKNALELGREHTDSTFRQRFARAFALSFFFRRAILPPSYEPSRGFAAAVSLSDAGRGILTLLRDASTSLSEHEIAFAMFLDLYHIDLHVDLGATDLDTVEAILHEELKATSIRYPWVYDRLLYDRFFDIFPANTDSLIPEETALLLKGTPQGVFQLGDMVVGPMGVARSASRRRLYPLASVPLWHCSDIACQSMHAVHLNAYDTKVSAFRREVAETSDERLGPPAEWYKFYLDIASSSEEYYDDMNLDGIPWLLASAFTEKELRAILEALLEVGQIAVGDHIRILQAGSAGSQVAQLGRDYLLQAILTASDEAIVQVTEALVERNAIEVPSTETRSARYYASPGGWLDASWECSALGLRPVINHPGAAQLRLQRLIGDLYTSPEGSSRLAWSLRHVPGATTHDKLTLHFREADPRTVLVNLVIGSEETLERAFALMRFGSFHKPTSLEDEDWLVNKMLWKLGFDIRLFPRHLPLLHKRLRTFCDTVEASIGSSDESLERLRSASANLFVSLEETLDKSLSFCAWALLEDHFGHTKFECDLDEARVFMAETLNSWQRASRASAPGVYTYNGQGINTLQPLIAGFRILAELCEKYLDDTSLQDLRPADQFPGYHGHTRLVVFPFLHTHMLQDIRPEDVRTLARVMMEIGLGLTQANVASVRNRLQHNRRPEELPTRSELAGVAEAIRSAAGLIEANGIAPLISFYAGDATDAYARTRIALTDYRGVDAHIMFPSPFGPSCRPSIEGPMIIIPTLRIGHSSECPIFRFVQRSSYTDMWRDYPKRRLRIAHEAHPEGIE